MIEVDISNIWGSVSLPDLLGLEAEVSAAHMKLTEGTGPEGLPEPENDPQISRILAAAEKIRTESDVLVVIGGGLAARAVIELLQGCERNLGKGKGNPQIFFAGETLSSRSWSTLVRRLEGKDVSLCVISGAGEELGCAAALRGLKWLLERRYGTEEARKRICAVIAGDGGSLGRMAQAEGWERFSIPENAAGCRDALSPAGLLPMAAAGISVQDILQGAREAREAFELRSYENPVWLYAASRSLLYRKGASVELLASFEPDFGTMGRWWQQMFSAPAGKGGPFPAFAQFPADLDTLGSLVQAGEGTVFETVLRFGPPEQTVALGEDVKDLDGLNRLAGRSLEDLQEMLCQEAVEAHGDSGAGVICIRCGPCTPRTVGELLWFFQLSRALCAGLPGRRG